MKISGNNSLKKLVSLFKNIVDPPIATIFQFVAKIFLFQ